MAWPTKPSKTPSTTAGRCSIDLAGGGVPDATTLLNFRHLLERHDLCQGLFAAINADLAARGLLLRAGTLVDATLIAAPPSTKNKEKQRDPEMHQTKKGNQWYFGMETQILQNGKSATEQVRYQSNHVDKVIERLRERGKTLDDCVNFYFLHLEQETLRLVVPRIGEGGQRGSENSRQEADC